MPIRRLLDEGHTVAGFFYNPNIHPLAEYLRRREGAAEVASRYGIEMHWALDEKDYDSQAWLQMVLPAFSRENPGGRCPLCWQQRLSKTAELAARLGFDAFSTSLLYSRRQRHEEIAEAGQSVARNLERNLDMGQQENLKPAGAPLFLYRDFRPDWQAGINLSKEWGIYRQPYCGCLFSENDRYANDLAKSNQNFTGHTLTER
jgi:predicted adenine nucleotide alpha hydrolase (AANH) superfamily ATPase